MNNLFKNIEAAWSEIRMPSLEDIKKYREEGDSEKRLEMMYEFHISVDDMIEGDYDMLMADVHGQFPTSDKDSPVSYVEDGIEFHPHNGEWGEELCTLQEWIGCVRCGGYIDYDGYGRLATATHVSDVEICPSELVNYKFPNWATHVMWYNR